MAFMVYKKVSQGGDRVLCPTGETFSLAGYNLLHAAWERQGKPVGAGWHASADDLIRIHTQGAQGVDTIGLLIDFDPRARWRIGIIELLDVYAFTTAGDREGELWSPLMLRMRDVFYETYDPEIDQSKKDSIVARLPEPATLNESVEFLYLGGKTWTWGKNGMTNAVFLQGPAREYFRRFF